MEHSEPHFTTRTRRYRPMTRRTAFVCLSVLLTWLPLLVICSAEATALPASQAPASGPAHAASAAGFSAACAGSSTLPFEHADKLLIISRYRLMEAPQDAEALLVRGLAYEALGRQGRATADLLAAARLRPDLTRAHLALARAYASHGLFARAVRSYTAAIRLAPGSAEAYRERALVYSTLGAYERALADHRKAIALEPADACTYNDQGITQEDTGFQTDALASYSKAIELAPTLLPAITNRAFLLSDLGRYAEALADFERAAALAPDDAGIADGLRSARSHLSVSV